MKNSRLPVQMSPCLRIFFESLLKEIPNAIPLDELFRPATELALSPAVARVGSLESDPNYN